MNNSSTIEYPAFYDLAQNLAQKTMLITPARFLFNAGSTPKKWNEKMLNSSNFKVLDYFPKSSEVFPATDIKGGVAIGYIDNCHDFTPIRIFTGDSRLDSILRKVLSNDSFESFQPEVLSRTSYHLTEKLHIDYPSAKSKLSKGHMYDMSTNIFERLPEVFNNSLTDPSNEIGILGRCENSRTVKYIKREYVNRVINLDSFKVFTPSGSDGLSILGKKPVTILGPSIIGKPGVGATETFLSVGNFKTEQEAINLLKYLRTKFTRCLIAVLKVTPNTTPEKFKYVPKQEFSEFSDIDWSKSISEIDQQLQEKYGLSPEEIEFIETHVKEME